HRARRGRQSSPRCAGPWTSWRSPCRAFASSLLMTERSDGTTPGVPMGPATVTQFDYRLGVPMLLYTATTFAALARIAMPWFRSAGMYAGQLRKTADAID